MRILCDSNIFLALTLEAHSHHQRAVHWIESRPEPIMLCFCRATQLAYLAAFAQCSKLPFATFDRGFKQFRGLELILLVEDPAS